MFPGHRVPESNQCQLPRPWVPVPGHSHVPGHRVPQSNLSHVASTQVSAIKPQSSFQATGFQNQASVMLPGHRFHNQTSVIFQATGFQNQTSHVPGPGSNQPQHVTRIPQSNLSCSQATGFHHQTSVMLPGHRFPESNQVMFPGHGVPVSVL